MKIQIREYYIKLDWTMLEYKSLVIRKIAYILIDVQFMIIRGINSTGSF